MSVIEIGNFETEKTFVAKVNGREVEFTFSGSDVEEETLQSKISEIESSDSLAKLGAVLQPVVDRVFGNGKWEELFKASNSSTKGAVTVLVIVLKNKAKEDEKTLKKALEIEYLD